MKKIFIALSILFLLLAESYRVVGQINQLPIFREYAKAYKNNTRSLDGNPGTNYWQNEADYDIHARLDVMRSWLSGKASIAYKNNSPDTLDKIVIRLHPNITKVGASRAFSMKPDDVGEGAQITQLKIDGNIVDLGDRKRFKIQDTNASINLLELLLPQSLVSIEIEWNYHIPERWQLRTGKGDSSSYFIAYWYPQISVYDDIHGWDELPYTGLYEFYNDYADYDIKIEVPNAYGVWATGLLQNEAQVYSQHVQNKLQKAKSSFEAVHVISKEDYDKGQVLYNRADDYNIWSFKARSVPDFAFTFGDHYLWDAAFSTLPDGRKISINAVYRDEANDFREMVELTVECIDFLSTKMPGVPYPYPQMTIVQGTNSPNDGGMEFPMICNNPTSQTRGRAADIASHEIAHQYFPFLVGTNEKRYAWMDEGWAALFPVGYIDQIDTNRNRLKLYTKIGNQIAGTSSDLPLMTPSYLLDASSYFFPSYGKSSLAYNFLREELGDNIFLDALHQYISKWSRKHPTPYDFFNIVNKVSGKNLNWFWKAWFFERGSPDLSIVSVQENNGKTEISIGMVGNLPTPVCLNVTLSNGGQKDLYYPVGSWGQGKRELSVQVDGLVENVILGNDLIPDINKANNIYRNK